MNIREDLVMKTVTSSSDLTILPWLLRDMEAADSLLRLNPGRMKLPGLNMNTLM